MEENGSKWVEMLRTPRKKWGMNENEGYTLLFIVEWHLGGQRGLETRLGHAWGDVERLGTDLEELWMSMKKWGMNENEGYTLLFIVEWHLGGQGSLETRLGHMWGDVERLGTELEELWMNMHIYVSQLKDAELKTLIATYDIPLDLRPCLPDSTFRMINFPAGDTAIGIYSRIFDSSDKVPTSFNQDHVGRLKAHIVKFRDILEGVLVRSGLSRVWHNPMCDPVLRRSDNTVMSIHDFLCMPSLEKAMVQEEPHQLGTSILGRVADRTTPPALAGTAIPRASPEEIAVTRPDHNVVTKANHAAKQKTSTGPEISTNTTKRTRLSQKVSGAGSSGLAAEDGVEQIDDGTLDDDGQRDGSEFAMEDIGNLNDVGQDKEVKTRAELSGSARRTTRASSHAVSEDASSSAQEAVAAPDTQPLGTDAGADEIASDGNVDSYFDARVCNIAGDVLERDLLPFVPGPYYIPYPFDEGSGSESPPYTRDGWEEIHGVNLGLLQKEIYKDPKVCRTALDRFPTPVETHRLRELSSVELSDRMSMLQCQLMITP
ncbi:hypothetical protein Tco_0013526 [Tanacetum coccineum]